MGKVYQFQAATVVHEMGEGQHIIRDEWVVFVEVMFRPAGPARKRRRGLYLMRELDETGRRYVGPVEVRLAEYAEDYSAGVRAAVLTRNSFRLTFDDEAAALFRKDEVRVAFDLTDEQFAGLRRELGEMFAGNGVYREEIA